MLKKIIIIFALIVSSRANCQENNLKINYSFGFPTTNINYLKNTSYLGFGFAFEKSIDENFILGFQVQWSAFSQFQKRNTYEIQNGHVTTSLYKYRQQVPITAYLDYIFLDEYPLRPYIGFGIGLNYINEKIYFNIYEIRDPSYGFLIQPKLGFNYSFDHSDKIKIFTEAVFNYSSNKSETFKYYNSGFINLNFGLRFEI